MEYIGRINKKGNATASKASGTKIANNFKNVLTNFKSLPYHKPKHLCTETGEEILKKLSVDGLKAQFGAQLRSYRISIGLTLKYFAEMHRTTSSYLSSLEKGRHNLSLETMQFYADTFGVAYYVLANPAIPIPPLEKMPLSTRRAVAKFEKEERQKAADKQKLKDAGAGIYRIGLAKSLHGLIEAGFFRKPHTSKEAFLKLNSDIKPSPQRKVIEKAIPVKVWLHIVHQRGPYLKNNRNHSCG